MGKIVIFGSGEIGEIAHYYFTKDTQHKVAAFTLNRDYIKQTSFKDLPVVPFEEIEKNFPPEEFKMFIAIGYSRLNKLRADKYFEAKKKGYELATYVSTKCTVFDNVKIGDNCFILELNNLQPFSTIGNNVTVWSGNHIGHHSKIGDHCFIASHVVISGGVKVEPYCFIAVNVSIADHVRIAKECIIGAGALIMKDTQEKGVYVAKRAELLDKPSDQIRGFER